MELIGTKHLWKLKVQDHSLQRLKPIWKGLGKITASFVKRPIRISMVNMLAKLAYIPWSSEMIFFTAAFCISDYFVDYFLMSPFWILVYLKLAWGKCRVYTSRLQKTMGGSVKCCPTILKRGFTINQLEKSSVFSSNRHGSVLRGCHYSCCYSLNSVIHPPLWTAGPSKNLGLPHSVHISFILHFFLQGGPKVFYNVLLSSLLFPQQSCVDCLGLGWQNVTG